ncbi:MAG: hypothetical protein WA435_13585, partial [Gallionellaceae bacterium]
ASVPTLKLFDFQYNKFGFSVSSATLLLLTQILVCCIDRLNPQTATGRSIEMCKRQQLAPYSQSNPQFIHVVNIGIGLIADVKQHSKAESNIVQTGSKELAHLLIWNGIFGQLR